MDKLAIIGTGYMARIIAQRAKELNIESHCFSIDENDVAVKAADFFHCVNILDVEKLLKLCRDIGINGVVATTELTIWPASFVATNLGLLGNDMETAKNITNKSIIRDRVSKSKKILQPKFCTCSTNDIPLDINYFPVIVKPIAAGGKRGISVVDKKDDIEKALLEAISISKVKGALVEEFLEDGKEYSVESLSYKGKHFIIQVTEKDSSGPPHCVELGHHQPADLSFVIRKKVEDATDDVLTLAGITNGPCHTEIKIIDGDIYLIEINGRPGGDHIAYPLTELSTGYPYITGIIMAALGKLDESMLCSFESNFAGVYFVTTQNPWLKSVFDNCDEQPWLYKKNKISKELQPIIHNDGFNMNYFIYLSKESRPNFNSIE